MTIGEKNGSEKPVLYIKGRIDSTTAPEMESFIFERLDGLDKLVLDVTEVEYMSSAGLRVLLSAHKSMGEEKGSITIIGAAGEVDDALRITGFDNFINIEESEEEKPNAEESNGKGEDT